jgi:WD40 repeat protein
LAASGVDGRTGTNRIFFWDVATGKTLGELAADFDMYALAFAPDGKTLATAGAGKVLRLWDWRAGTELRRIQADKAGWWTLAFSPDSKVLAAASLKQRTVQLWDAATGRPLRALGDGPGLRSSVVFSPDGQTVATASGKDKTVRLWDVATGKEVRQFTSELGIYSLAFSPNGKLLAAGCNPESGKLSPASPIHLWDVHTGKEVWRLPGHVFTVTSLAFSADGTKLVSGRSSSVVKVWDIAAGKEGVPLAEHESWVMSVAYSPDGRLLATSSLDGTIRLWQPATGKLVRVFEGDAGPQVLHVAFSPDGRSLVSDRPDASLRFWDVATGRQTRRLPMGKDTYSHPFAYAPDGRTLAVWRPDGTVQLLDASTGKEKWRLMVGASDGAYLCFSPDGEKLASLSFSLTGRSGVLQVWNAATGTEKHKWTVARYGPIAFSPDGRTLMGGTGDYHLPAGTKERTFHRWDVVTGEDRPFVAAQHARVDAVTISPDGRVLAWGDTDGIITLWDLATERVRRRLQGHHSYVRSLAFSPDGKSLASGSSDTTALVWDVTGRPAAAQSDLLAAERLPALWADLASVDAAQAFDAIGILTASPEQTGPMLKDKLHPAPAPADRQQLARLIADLDSEQFAVRQKATEQLRKLGERAEPALQDALNGQLTLEARKRIEELLKVLQDVSASPERLRELRAVEVLEHIGTADARQVLQTLAKGAAEARLTREAKASLERLAKRHHPVPK